MTNSSDIKYLNALNKISGVGAQKLRKLMSFFGNAEIAWSANLEPLLQSGIGEKLAERIFDERKNTNPDLEWANLEKENIQLLEWNNPSYPALLKESSHPPYLLYVKSSLGIDSIDFSNLITSPMVAIVGARKNTAYG